MRFEIIPAVDLKDRRVVQLQQGDFSKEIISLPDPVSVVENWIGLGADVIHMVDLNGAFGGRLAHEDVIIDVRKKFPDLILQVGGGIRDRETAVRLLESGIDRVIIGTGAMRDREMVEKLAGEYEDRIVVAIDSRRGQVVVEGWRRREEVTPVEVAESFKHSKVLFLFTNVDVEGLMSGIDMDVIKKVLKKTGRRCIVSGGISSYDDVRKIKEAGAGGVVIGSALYTGLLDLKKLNELFSG